MENFEKIGVHMSVKLHFLHHHSDYFKDNLKNLSDQHGERFHQTLLSFERRYRNSDLHERLLADFLWLNK